MNSKFFKDEEFQCSCGKCNSFVFSDTLLRILDAIREEYGEPIIINSAYRCPEYNRDTGGKLDSAHIYGKAVDIRCIDNIHRFKLLKIILKYSIKRIGVNKGFIHCDLDESKPQDVIWVY